MMKSQLASSALFALVLLASGCTEADEDSSASIPLHTRVDTVEGTPWVRNVGTPETWQLEETLQLGSSASLGEPEPDEFGRVSSAVLGPDNQIYVADGFNFEVRVFDIRGGYRFRFGRNGEGPGEFGALYSLAWVGDTLLSLDFGVGRVGMFDEGGEWLGQHRHPGRISGSGRQLRFYQTTPHEAYVWSIEVRGNDLARVFIRYTSGGPVDTIPVFTLESPPEATILCEPGDGSIHFWTIPYAPRLLQHPLRDGLRAVALTDQYRIALINPVGDTVRVIERIQDPVGTRDDGPFWEVISPEGALLGRVPDFPRGERTVPYFRDDRILNVVPDSLGVETVHLLRYSRPGGGEEDSSQPPW